MNPDSTRMSDARWRHETKHSDQWALFGGGGFVPAWIVDNSQAWVRWKIMGSPGDCDYESLMLLENMAGLDDGGYDN